MRRRSRFAPLFAFVSAGAAACVGDPVGTFTAVGPDASASGASDAASESSSSANADADANANANADSASDARTDGDAKISDAETYFVSALYPTLQPTCQQGNCHGPGGAVPFFGADAASTYVLFKTYKFNQVSAANPFLTKGLHSGPSLTDVQKNFFQVWLSLEPPMP